ncbi:MAG TPA: FHA domain-containing protein, partial [Aggregatilineales bacterium]|nr:FHA domain-containing protein [Aggregatilineales bacterium]
PLLPVVVVSASSEPNIVAQSIEAGADVFMSKPINIHELKRVVGALINRNANDNPALKTKQLGTQPALNDVSEPLPSNAIVLFVQNHREPISLILDRQIVLGRRLGTSRGQAQLDLEEYSGFDKGVSRTHARLVREDKSVFIEDLGSSNGTFVNGRDIGAHQSYSLSNGDELRLGELRITIYLLQDAEQSSLTKHVARQAGD